MNKLTARTGQRANKTGRNYIYGSKPRQILLRTAQLLLLAAPLVTISLPGTAADSADPPASGLQPRNSCCRTKLAEATKTPEKASGNKDSTREVTEKKKKPEEATTAVERKPVLDPSQFFGLASFGYASAKACPEVMEKLFCYCGCDLTDSHTSLLDCFTSVHGVDCHICQEEAVLANKMNKDGISIKEIQKKIDETYASQYPFESDTATYKKYKSTRLWTQNDPGTEPAKFGTQQAGPDAPDDKNSTPPKLKPGREAGKCCSAGEHKEGKGEKPKEEKPKKTKTSKKSPEKS